MNKMLRPGYYVEGKFFAGRSAQAHSFAQFRANEYGRPVKVTCREFDGMMRDIKTVEPGKVVP